MMRVIKLIVRGGISKLLDEFATRGLDRFSERTLVHRRCSVRVRSFSPGCVFAVFSSTMRVEYAAGMQGVTAMWSRGMRWSTRCLRSWHGVGGLAD